MKIMNWVIHLEYLCCNVNGLSNNFNEIIMWEDHCRRHSGITDNIYNKLSNVMVFGHNEL